MMILEGIVGVLFIIMMVSVFTACVLGVVFTLEERAWVQVAVWTLGAVASFYVLYAVSFSP